MNRSSISQVAWPIILTLLVSTATLISSANGSPTRAEKLDVPELRYRVLARFRDAFFCDPDLFPVARRGEEQRSLKAFSEIRRDGQLYDAISRHLGLDARANVTDEQKVLVYREYKKLRWGVSLQTIDDKYQFKIATKDQSGSFRIQGTIDSTGNIILQKKERAVLTCPKCLALDTYINTPNGAIRVQDLRPGMLVWTLSSTHQRIAMPIQKIVAIPIIEPHSMIHLTFADGRELAVSPGHPTTDGRTISQLKEQATYDGAQIRRVVEMSYHGSKTYDLLPAGETGFYWANGILLRSTLR